MLNEDVLKEFIFDARMRKLSERTIKGYKNNNLRFFRFIEQGYQITELEDTYTQAIKGYIDYLSSLGRKETYINGKNNNLRFFRFIEQGYQITELEDTYTQAIKGYIDYLSSLGRKETYINGIIKNIRAYFTYCMNEGYLRKNPMDKVKFQKEPVPLITTFNDDEVVRMIKHFNGARFLDVRNKLLMTLLFDTGLRNSEICNLKVTDIRDTYIFVDGKGKKQRAVPISPILNKQIIKYNRVRTLYIKDKFAYQTEYYLLSQKGKKLTVEAIERIVKDCGEACKVREGIRISPHTCRHYFAQAQHLLSQKGKKLTVEAIERIVKDCGEACKVREGIRISPHTCRHYFAQAQLKNGCDLYTLSRLMGHNNPNITKIYLRSMNDNDFLDLAVGTSPLMNL